MRHHILTLLILPALPAALLAQKADEIQLSTTFQNAEEPEIAASGSSVVVVWAGQLGLFFNRSEDAGASWLASDMPFGASARPTTNPDLRTAVDGASLFVAWADDRNGQSDIYLNHSTDRGATWATSDARVSTLIGANARVPQIATSGSSVFVTWQDGLANQRPDVFLNYSRDGGATWQSVETQINSAAPGTLFSTAPQIATLGNSVVIAWEGAPLVRRSAGPPDVYVNHSQDGGATWLSSEIKLNTTTPAASPRLATSGTQTYVAWIGTPAGIYFDSSSDGGATWGADIQLDPGANGSPEGVQIAASGSSVFVCWEDGGNIYLNHSADQGQTWQSSARQLNTNASEAANPQLAVKDALVTVVWEDSRRAGAPDVFCNYSSDGGATWLVVDLRINTDLSGINPPLTDGPRIATSDAAVYVTWMRLAPLQPPASIRFNIPFGLQPYGSGSAGSAGLVPTLAGIGHPTRGDSVALEVSNGLGGTNAVLAIGVLQASQISVPLLGGTLLVQPTATQPFLLNGNGTASLPISLPRDPFLRGVNFNFQALLLDPGAPSGLSMTNAVQMWIG